MATKKVLASVAQFCAGNNVGKNLETVLELIKEGSRRGSEMIFFPEASDYIAENKQQGLELAQKIDGEFLTSIRQSAKQHKLWLSIGVHELAEGDRPYNSNVVVDNNGEIVSVYRKLHLFNVNIKNGPQISEANTTSEGSGVVKPIDTPVGKLGLAICYDVRFPELALALRELGSQGIAYPSVFTEKTGAAHWHVLMRARAIETQCYVYSSAQIGNHNAKRSSYGCSMIIDPWGTVIAHCPSNNEPSLATAEIDLEYVEKVRGQIPVFENRRRDVFRTNYDLL
ncbi:hypothetical protein BB559_001819 [Furculomyces boomerangus]|uniref:CN hydrolase domain-containing protein n=2 Tax=Harpellales TaxID=61421 RepID=A0A2T9Z0A7_9FUNG|nr:hypothetical protein BB559_001819 [Furculomyces boomerangus]PWA03788.1 hypothetical protein BB558_000071 [Smittium angustum]